MKRFFLFIALLATSIYAQAQDAGDFTIGIKAGLNFVTFHGPSERSSTDTRLESNSIITRFFAAPTFRYALTDKTGLLVEIQYSQKGGSSSYTGESYWTTDYDEYLANPTGGIDTLTFYRYFSGNRSVSVNTNNGYLDIPLMFYGKANSNISFYGGPYVAFLLNSSGAGQLTFDASARDFNNITIDLQPINIELDHDYRKDPQDDFLITYQQIYNVNSVGGIEPFGDQLAPRITDAYYDYRDQDEFLDASGEFAKKGNFYNSLDYGLMGGMEYRFDTGLGIGLRASYGLADITNNAYDYSKVSANIETDAIGRITKVSRTPRKDRDGNLLLQLYIGFEL